MFAAHAAHSPSPRRSSFWSVDHARADHAALASPPRNAGGSSRIHPAAATHTIATAITPRRGAAITATAASHTSNAS
ncbi:MAG: hypothetical protein IPK07_22430 [Deltaproteobacteria bacterium]|nr:hypothetical protein [Deltaproteobacteria bacterium]